MFEDSFIGSNKNVFEKALAFPAAIAFHAVIIGAAFLFFLDDLPGII